MQHTGTASLIIDPDRYLVYRSDATIHLTKTEFRILLIIAGARGRILTRDQIADIVWKTEPMTFPRSIDVHICHIRKKIGPFDGKHSIISLKGVGYKIIDEIHVIILNETNVPPALERNSTIRQSQ